MLNGKEVLVLDESIHAIGKSKQGNIFGIAAKDSILFINGWDGEDGMEKY